MKGLLVKDFCLMLQRKRSFIVILVCGLVMSFSSDISFIAGWLILIGSIFALSTIAYDEHDNCFPFLMTLPAGRKCYAAEKYVFGFLCGLAFWLIGAAFCFAAAAIGGDAVNLADELPALLAVLLVPVIILDFSIPLNLKYGTEKARIYMLVFWGLVTAAAFAIYKLLPSESSSSLPDGSVSAPAVIAALVVGALVLTAFSIWRSMRIMEKKEF